MKNLKKLGLVAGLATLMSFGAEAQWSGSTTITSTSQNASIGINTTTPRGDFEIKQPPFNNPLNSVNMFSIVGNNFSWITNGIGFNLSNKPNFTNTTNSWSRASNGWDNGGSSIISDPYGNLRFITVGSTGTSITPPTDVDIKNSTFFSINSVGIVNVGKGIHYWDGISNNGDAVAMKINGQTLISDDKGIFATLPAAKNARFGVNGLIVANGIKVLLPVNNAWSWPDYVFKKDYKLRPLAEVEQFIAANNHLPDVPSEAAVKENGIDVANMDAVLLRKVEELTLYMIQIQKDNLELKAKLEALSK